jgi:hypothetical protein
VIPQTGHGVAIGERRSATHVHSVEHASERVEVVGRRELRVKRVFRSCKRMSARLHCQAPASVGNDGDALIEGDELTQVIQLPLDLGR